ncbi:MAG: ABC transporter permease [Acidobacteria bacterium]|nr:ABC transporter permease [Acidobacteriota bacterium]
MTLSSSFNVALKALGRNKLQTGLTMVGMTIGVATVLAMVALGTGAESAIEDQIRAAGMNLIVVTAGNYQMKSEVDPGGAIEPQAFLRPEDRYPGLRLDRPFEETFAPRMQSAVYYGEAPAVRLAAAHPEDDPMASHDHPTSSQRLGDAEAGLGSASTLTRDDTEAIRKIAGVQYVSSGIHMNVHAVFGDQKWFTRLHGADLDLPLIRRAWAVDTGRYFNGAELDQSAQVVVLGSIAAEKLFGAQSPVGKTVDIFNQPFQVTGVVSSSSPLVRAAIGDEQFDAVYVPISTLQRLLNLAKLNDISLTASNTGDVTRISKEVTDLLRFRHNIGLREPDDFTVASQARKALAGGSMPPGVQRAIAGNAAELDKITLEQLAKTFERASRTMTALLGSVAAVSLLVGGIGIMNIMMLSVTERTREIGIRRAVGARSRDVLRQFIIEAVTLSVIGGAAGIAIGLIASSSIERVMNWSTTVSPTAIGLAFGISAAVGVFFGYYPARTASKVLPIQSLRYE